MVIFCSVAVTLLQIVALSFETFMCWEMCSILSVNEEMNFNRNKGISIFILSFRNPY